MSYLIQSLISYRICVWEQAYDSYIYSLRITLNRLIKFILLKPTYYCNHFSYLELNVSPIYIFYNINTLMSLCKFRHNILFRIIHDIKIILIYLLLVMHYRKQIGSCMYVGIQICILLKIKIQDFTNLNMFKSFI